VGASAIALPAFRSGPALPAAGTTPGEAFLNTTSNTAFVWTGNVWEPIVPSALLVYPDDSAVLADGGQPAGTYAASAATGNLFIMGSAGWRQIGVRSYPTAAGLLADTPMEGSLGLALDERSVWVRGATDWMCISVRHFPDFATLDAWTPADGAQALDVGTGIAYLRVNGAWRSGSVLMDTEANVMALTTTKAGQMAVASDTGRLWVYDGTAWVGSPIVYYVTEVALLAATPADGVLAMAEDTGLIYGRMGGAWRRVNSPTSTVANAVPATPAAGDIWLDTSGADPALKTYTGAAWVRVGAKAPLQGTLAARPALSAVATGDIYIATNTRQAFIAAPNVWIETSTAAGTVNVQPPQYNFKNQYLNPQMGTVTRFVGNFYPSQAANAILAINKTGGAKMVNSDFTMGRHSIHDYSANGAAQIGEFDGGGGAGNGWYSLTKGTAVPRYAGYFEMTFNLIGRYQSIYARTHYMAPDYHQKSSEFLYSWDNNVVQFENAYLSLIQGQDIDYYLRQV
jgi:hypothetical protein